MAKVPISNRGTVTAGMTVAQKLRRKMKITMTTSAIVRISVKRTSETEARMGAARSYAIETLMAGGMEDSSCGSSALTLSTVAMTLAPDTRMIGRMIARCLLYHPAN